jgi:hypothetical protein
MGTDNDPRERLQLRVSPDLERQVEDYGRRTGMNLNSAAIALLVEGLRSTEGTP